MIEKKPTRNNEALLRITKRLMKEAMETQDDRITKLAMMARDFVKESDIIDEMILMIPDDDEGYQSPYTQPQPQTRRRR